MMPKLFCKILFFGACFLGLMNPTIVAQQLRFEAGNRAYQQRDFAKALQEYHQIAAQGIKSDALFYNMGNAYFRRGQLGAAILYYEKARQLNPYDSRIAHSLEVARSKSKNQIPEVPEAFWTTAWRYLLWFFTLEGFFWIGIGLYILVFLLIAHWIWFTQPTPWRRRTLMVLIPLTVVFLGASIFAAYKENVHQFAVVQPKKTEILATPVSDGQSVRVLYEGLTVKILHREGAWFRVKLPNGLEGWMQKRDLAII